MAYPRPSLKAGFARHAGESEFPNLWDNLTGAWVPSLGVSRVIPNLGLRKGYTSLGTNNTIGTVKGPSVVSTAGSDTNQRFTLGPLDTFIGAKNVTVVTRYEKTDATFRSSSIFACDVSAADTRSISAEVPWSDGNVYWDFGGFSTHRITASGLTFADDVWVFRAGDLGMQIWQNGFLRQTRTAVAARNITGGANIWLFWGGNQSGQGTNDAARLYTFLLYNRNLTEQEVKLISREPLAPFILKQPITVALG